MDIETPDDDLTSWAIPLDEPDVVPTPAPVAAPVAQVPPADDPPRLSLLSRDVPNVEFQPRLKVSETR